MVDVIYSTPLVARATVTFSLCVYSLNHGRSVEHITIAGLSLSLLPPHLTPPCANNISPCCVPVRASTPLCCLGGCVLTKSHARKEPKSQFASPPCSVDVALRSPPYLTSDRYMSARAVLTFWCAPLCKRERSDRRCPFWRLCGLFSGVREICYLTEAFIDVAWRAGRRRPVGRRSGVSSHIY